MFQSTTAESSGHSGENRPPVNGILTGFRDDMNGSEDFGHDVGSHAEFWLSTREDWDVSDAETSTHTGSCPCWWRCPADPKGVSV